MQAGNRHLHITGCPWLVTLFLTWPLAAVAAPELPVIPVCYNYNCSRTAEVRPSADEWQAVRNQFRPAAASAAEERQMIRRAVALMEYIAGTQTPTFRDLGRNPIVDDWPGQMDCIDESTNTWRYLVLFQESGLLRWHHVIERAYRAPYLFDPHWAGQIVERGSGEHYVVDSWFLDNGNMPYIQSVSAWKRKEPIPTQ